MEEKNTYFNFCTIILIQNLKRKQQIASSTFKKKTLKRKNILYQNFGSYNNALSVIYFILRNL